MKYAIIGAGPCGLAAAKVFLDYGIAFDGFESGPDVGGLWDINNPSSTVYESAHLISSKYTTGYDCYPMPPHYADYPSHRQVWKYFDSFAEHFKLRPHFRFNTPVMQVTPSNAEASKWIITLANGEQLTYNGVIIASGTFHKPEIPSFKGNFAGQIVHSSEYKNADLFHHKRVLVVGAGNSGCDIAVDAIYRAKSVTLSMRRGYHFVPKYVFGKPADIMGGLIQLPRFLKRRIDKWLLGWFAGNPQRLGFPKPDHDLYELHPVVNTLVLYHAGHGDLSIKPDIDYIEGHHIFFKDKSSDEFDIILAATGYKLHYPFIDRQYLNWEQAAPQLFLNIFNPKHHNLFMLGMIEATGIGWQGRYEQAELVAAYIQTQQQAPDRARAFEQAMQNDHPDLSGGYNYKPLMRMSFYVHKDTYRKTMKKYLALCKGK
jgi:hypothetical protein